MFAESGERLGVPPSRRAPQVTVTSHLAGNALMFPGPVEAFPRRAAARPRPGAPTHDGVPGSERSFGRGRCEHRRRPARDGAPLPYENGASRQDRHSLTSTFRGVPGSGSTLGYRDQVPLSSITVDTAPLQPPSLPPPASPAGGAARIFVATPRSKRVPGRDFDWGRLQKMNAAHEK